MDQNIIKYVLAVSQVAKDPSKAAEAFQGLEDFLGEEKVASLVARGDELGLALNSGLVGRSQALGQFERDAFGTAAYLAGQKTVGKEVTSTIDIHVRSDFVAGGGGAMLERANRYATAGRLTPTSETTA